MSPKTAFTALDQLIDHEWKTCLETTPDRRGEIRWRGFRGTYRISWTDSRGQARTCTFELR